MLELRASLESYLVRVKELAPSGTLDVSVTKRSLVEPLMAALGHELADPRIAVVIQPASPETLGEAFARDERVCLGVLTNGVHWQFFTDSVGRQLLDREPFARWDALTEAPPYEVLRLLSHARFDAELLRGLARRTRQREQVLGELTRLLQPAGELTRLAVANIETADLTQPVLEQWQPIVASALNEWVRMRAGSGLPWTATNDNSKTRPSLAPRIETTQGEIDAFSIVQRLLGAERAIAYEDTPSYFKLHMAPDRTRVLARLQVSGRQTVIWVPLSVELTIELVDGRDVTPISGWSTVTLDSVNDIADLGELFIAAYTQVQAAQGRRGASAA
jgi:hypothetical protein